MKIVKLTLILYFIFFQSYAKSNTNFNDWLVSFKKIALSDRSHKEIGSQDYLRKLNSLDSNSIVKNIIVYH